MSNCMTIADETIDQKDTCTEVTPKDVVEFILEEALLSAFITSDKDCSRIGDFNITDDFRQQYDRFSHLKDFEQIDHSQNQSASNQESNLNSKENLDHPGSLVTARENLESIVDSFFKDREIIKPSNECTVISEDVLADSELQIKNGQIHLEKNKADKVISDLETPEYFDKKDVVKDEKIEIEYYNEGKLNKIYVPLNQNSHSDIICASGPEPEEERNRESCEEMEVKTIVRDEADKLDGKEVTERPFKPFTTEELRQSTLQVWENGNSSLVGKWDGDMLAQTEEVVRLMEELSSAQMLTDSFADPNRPRACSFAEEDVKKIIKEIEEITFTQSRTNSDDFDVPYFPDGQGDADLESKSFTKSKDSMDKSHKERKLLEESNNNLASDPKFSKEKKSESIPEDKKEERFPPEEVISSQSKELSNHVYATTPDPLEISKTSDTNTTNEDNKNTISFDSKPPTDNIKELEPKLQYQTLEEEALLKSNSYNESSFKMKTSLDQVVYPTFTTDPPSERVLETKQIMSCASYLVNQDAIRQKTSEIFLTDSVNLKEFQNDHNICDEFFPESVSLSGNMGSLSGSKQDEFTLKNLELSSELDMKSFQEKHSDIIKGSRSVKNTSETTSEWNHSTQQAVVDLETLNCASGEMYNIVNLHSFVEEKNSKKPSDDSEPNIKMSEEKIEGKEIDNSSQESGALLVKQDNDSEMLTSDEISPLNQPKMDEGSEDTMTSNEKSAVTVQEFEEKTCNAENELLGAESQILAGDSSLSVPQNVTSPHESNKSLNNTEETNDSETKEPSASSQTLSGVQSSKESLSENGHSENAEAPDASTRKFKLHSQKMYFGADPAGQALNEFTLTESEETFIDLTESVIQIIEPPDNSADEDYNKVTFSLLSEVQNQNPPRRDAKPEYEFPLEKYDDSESDIPDRKVYSGMSTIGPIRNIDYDPKDLTAPDIDFGKMTRITSSRQLAKDMNLFNSEVNAALSVKIIEEDDSDDEASLNTEDDRLEHSSLVNRDIASLTKVQKVREVMSYQPKSEEDFEDEEALPRPRLDLKDVESMTDERYKVPDVSIPLLSFEIGDNNLDAGKELIESMGLVISGLTNPAYYEAEIEQENSTIQKKQSCLDSDCSRELELPCNNVAHSQSLGVLKKDEAEEETSVQSLEKESKSKVDFFDETEPDECLKTENENDEGGSTHPKYSTLGSVFRKASSRFIRKEGDSLIGNSKSLPRDPSKMSTTDSIRSIIDDCQSSASSMLNKSRSFLKNTQSIFKSISQSRMTSDRDAEHGADKKKLSPSESDVSTIEKKFPAFLKKEDFTKAKNLIKCKVEKTLRNFDISGSTAGKPEISSEKKDLRVVIRNEENFRVDRVENFKKLLPKSPLVYKSQFVKSQMNFQSDPLEPAEASAVIPAENDQQNQEETVDAAQVEVTPAEEKDLQTKAVSNVNVQEKLQWVNSIEELYSSVNEESEPKQPAFIVMETIQGLPPAELESPSSEKENLDVEKNVIKIEKENELKRTEASNSFQLLADGACDVAPCFPEIDEEKTATKTPSERKIKTKKKKFATRFRNFWCSAFGRVKTTPKKGDLS